MYVTCMYMWDVHACQVHVSPLYVYVHAARTVVEHLVSSLSFYLKESNYSNDIIG